MARITAVLFDMDDTLIDWSGMQGDITTLESSHLQKVHQYLTQLGYTLPAFPEFWTQLRKTLIQAWGEAKKEWTAVSFTKELQKFLISCGVNASQINMDGVLHAYAWEPVPGVQPFADTLPVLAQLKRSGYKIGLITNAMQPMWMRDIELRAYGILDYLDARLTSGDVGFMKPHPFIFWQALEQLGVTAQEAVFVGDRPANDIVGANEAGLISVLMAPAHLKRKLNGVQPAYTITALTQLLPILAQLEGDS